LKLLKDTLSSLEHVERNLHSVSGVFESGKVYIIFLIKIKMLSESSVRDIVKNETKIVALHVLICSLHEHAPVSLTKSLLSQQEGFSRTKKRLFFPIEVLKEVLMTMSADKTFGACLGLYHWDRKVLRGSLDGKDCPSVVGPGACCLGSSRFCVWLLWEIMQYGRF
jgi:hypothetical protein